MCATEVSAPARSENNRKKSLDARISGAEVLAEQPVFFARLAGHRGGDLGELRIALIGTGWQPMCASLTLMCAMRCAGRREAMVDCELFIGDCICSSRPTEILARHNALCAAFGK